ncbi:hypothetical protein E2C01_005202 [Portunus trituberculatus]|uniref:Uncharacterized protein n=1 Tax=Portunus trituberculatus TaxID=210409 RepID=A0A5B7CRZ8_PORTR|nr:hypothetical protein [Portunus trituberculatus]
MYPTSNTASPQVHHWPTAPPSHQARPSLRGKGYRGHTKPSSGALHLEAAAPGVGQARAGRVPKSNGTTLGERLVVFMYDKLSSEVDELVSAGQDVNTLRVRRCGVAAQGGRQFVPASRVQHVKIT